MGRLKVERPAAHASSPTAAATCISTTTAAGTAVIAVAIQPDADAAVHLIQGRSRSKALPIQRRRLRQPRLQLPDLGLQSDLRASGFQC